MASLKRRIIKALAAYLDQTVGFPVSTRTREEMTNQVTHAIVYQGTETKRIRNGAGGPDGEWNATAAIEILVELGDVEEGIELEDALDEAMTELEAAIPWEDPDVLAVPGVRQLEYGSNRVGAPDDTTDVIGVITLEVLYKHDLQNPGTVGGVS